MNTIDLTPLVSGVVLPFAQAVLLALAPLVAAYLLRKFRIDRQSALGQQVQSAVQAGAGVAYHILATQGAQLTSVPVRNAAIAAGVNHAMATAPAALKALGITPDAVQAGLVAEFGRLLAASPTEGLAPPVLPAPPPAETPPATALDHPV